MKPGDRFGRLTVVGMPYRVGRDCKVKVRCDCGAVTAAWTGNVQRGATKSCGCLRRTFSRTHGLCSTRLYNVWRNMCQRCGNPHLWYFPYYGGRGIRVCKAWHKFLPFYRWAVSHGYRDDLTLDRKNNDGNYTPSNCRWATRAQQAQNQRRRRNNMSGYVGVYWCRAKWAACVQFCRRTKHLGSFSDPFSAAWVRDVFVKRHYDKHATLNNLVDRRKRSRKVNIERRKS
jgi:hypothetical protein